jgi:hypothetical protein
MPIPYLDAFDLSRVATTIPLPTSLKFRSELNQMRISKIGFFRGKEKST